MKSLQKAKPPREDGLTPMVWKVGGKITDYLAEACKKRVQWRGTKGLSGLQNHTHSQEGSPKQPTQLSWHSTALHWQEVVWEDPST